MNIKQIKKRLQSLTPIEIFILITIAFLTIFIVKFFGRKKEFITIKVEVIKQNWLNNYDPYGYRAPYWISDKVKIGQTEKDKAGKIIATLIDLENYERGDEEAELYLTLKVQTTLDKRTGVYYFKDKSLNLGSSIELNLNNIELHGQIIDNNVPQNGYPTKYFTVTARARNLDSWVYEKITPNLKVYNRATGETVGEITKVNLENSSLQEIKTDSTGKYLVSASQKNKDAIIDIKIKAYQMDGKWFFTGHQDLKINNYLKSFLYLYTEKINLYDLEIQNIKEIN
jgi:hypothetical protein